MSLSRQILIGLALGVLTGVFFGERVAFLQVGAEIYVKLLQMTVLPYVTVSLISGLGRLDLAQAKALGLRAGAVMAVLWAIALGAVFLFPLTFPSVQTASFFSTTLIESREPFDLVALYIPSNPFYSLANNVVPAVVLFSIVLGVALIAVPTKNRLLDVLDVVSAAVSRANNLIARLTPFGIFAIAAAAAGTLAMEQIERLQVYLIGYVAIALLISLWILPGLITALTPLRYREVMGTMKDAILTAFMTSNLFIVLPMLVEHSQALMRKHGLGRPQDTALPEVVVPASFNFPHVGKLLSLSFVLFAGWFADAAVPVSDFVRLASTGLVVLFGNINAAMPFLLDLFRIPADAFQLFLATSVVNARFGTLMAVTHTMVMALVGSWAIAGRLEINARRIVRYLVVSLLLTVATVLTARLLCGAAVSPSYDRDQMLMGMRLLTGRGVAKMTPTPAASDTPSSTMDRVRSSGIVRACWLPDALPFAFVNSRRELVGLDVEMMQDLAAELNATAEFVQVPRANLVAALGGADCDIMIGGIAMTASRAAEIRFSRSYVDETLAFVVRDDLRQTYSDWSAIKRRGRVTIGVPAIREFEMKVRAQLPEADLVHLSSADEIFKRLGSTMEAFTLTAERGSAWTLLHPELSVAVPLPGLMKVPLAYPIARKDDTFATVVNTWIDLRTKDGLVERLYNRWILGRVEGERKPRWSVMGDVLHWGK
jgi:Na+/H+-dicarboxylate symporter/ABC-type amino acid transport substrate-binding protein